MSAYEAAVREAVAALPGPVIFAAVTGSRLYGLASPRSDVDIRAVHLAPSRSFLGLSVPEGSRAWSEERGGLSLDLASFELGRFLELVLFKKSGNALEALFSPLTFASGSDHARLRELASGCLCRRHSHHYLGFSRRLWAEAREEGGLRVKPALQAFRAVLTGIHLMGSRRVLCDLESLLEHHPVPGLAPLIAAKRSGASEAAGDPGLGVALDRHFPKLVARLEESRDSSPLPEDIGGFEALEAFLIDRRLRALADDPDAI